MAKNPAIAAVMNAEARLIQNADRNRGSAKTPYPLDTPMTNLLLTMMDSAGVHLDKLGDSTGRLNEPLSI